jgi:hypothetical protein
VPLCRLARELASPDRGHLLAHTDVVHSCKLLVDILRTGVDIPWESLFKPLPLSASEAEKSSWTGVSRAEGLPLVGLGWGLALWFEFSTSSSSSDSMSSLLEVGLCFVVLCFHFLTVALVPKA